MELLGTLAASAIAFAALALLAALPLMAMLMLSASRPARRGSGPRHAPDGSTAARTLITPPRRGG